MKPFLKLIYNQIGAFRCIVGGCKLETLAIEKLCIQTLKNLDLCDSEKWTVIFGSGSDSSNCSTCCIYWRRHCRRVSWRASNVCCIMDESGSKEHGARTHNARTHTDGCLLLDHTPLTLRLPGSVDCTSSTRHRLAFSLRSTGSALTCRLDVS